LNFIEHLSTSGIDLLEISGLLFEKIDPVIKKKAIQQLKRRCQRSLEEESSKEEKKRAKQFIRFLSNVDN
jgi:hypothetical protein